MRRLAAAFLLLVPNSASRRARRPWPSRASQQSAGGASLLAGVIYGAIKTNGFKRELASFEIPAE